MVVTFYDFLAPGTTWRWFALAAICCSLLGVVRREKFAASSLNHWDESAAFAALSVLLHYLTHGGVAVG
jgi:hypothetical protein